MATRTSRKARSLAGRKLHLATFYKWEGSRAYTVAECDLPNTARKVGYKYLPTCILSIYRNEGKFYAVNNGGRG